MEVGLIDVDGHNFPNLALMKLSAWHKMQGDNVEWVFPMKRYDVVYKSKVFTDEYSQDTYDTIWADKVMLGGTGYGLDNALPEEVEHMYPDYSLYPQFVNTAYGFLTRGCPRGCRFCIVGKKEGLRSRKVADLAEFWKGQREIKLLDPNLLACPEHMELLKQLADSGAWVDFTQGLDIRYINERNAELLNQVKVKMLHFAWDNPREDLTPHFKRFDALTKIKNRRRREVYVLTNFDSTFEEDMYRIYTLRELNYDAYVMIYNKSGAPRITRDLQRWCNNRILFHSTEFLDYVPRRDGIAIRELAEG